MSSEVENYEPSILMKILMYGAVTLIFLGGFYLLSLSEDEPDGASSCYSAKSSLCTESEPEPDYEEELDYTSTGEAYESDDRCGDYSCKELEQEAKQEIDQVDREIDAELESQGF